MSFVTYFSISNFFRDMPNLIEKGEKSLEAGKIKKITLRDGRAINATVEASMKKRSYEVDVTVEDKTPVSGSCTCPNGQYKCSHMAAVLLYAKTNWSQTDTQCQWNKGRSNGPHLQAAEMYPQDEKCLLKEAVQPGQVMWLYNQMQDIDCGFTWLLSPDVEPVDTRAVPSVEALLNGSDILQADDKVGALLDGLCLTRREVGEVEERTRGQDKNPRWAVARKGRLTASNFGLVLGAMDRGRYPVSLFKRLLDGYDPAGCAAVKWGKTHEAAAKQSYKRKTGTAVQECGIFLTESGILGASPDGVAGEKLVEVKCPWSHRDRTVFDAASADPKFCLDQNMELKTDHAYFHQVQGQLHIAGYAECDFVVWTMRDTYIVTVRRDESWAPNLARLELFYRVHMAPRLVAYRAQL